MDVHQGEACGLLTAIVCGVLDHSFHDPFVQRVEIEVERRMAQAQGGGLLWTNRSL